MISCKMFLLLMVLVHEGLGQIPGQVQRCFIRYPTVFSFNPLNKRGQISGDVVST